MSTTNTTTRRYVDRWSVHPGDRILIGINVWEIVTAANGELVMRAPAPIVTTTPDQVVDEVRVRRADLPRRVVRIGTGR